jgi:hypothetical protein
VRRERLPFVLVQVEDLQLLAPGSLPPDVHRLAPGEAYVVGLDDGPTRCQVPRLQASPLPSGALSELSAHSPELARGHLGPG